MTVEKTQSNDPLFGGSESERKTMSVDRPGRFWILAKSATSREQAASTSQTHGKSPGVCTYTYIYIYIMLACM